MTTGHCRTRHEIVIGKKFRKHIYSEKQLFTAGGRKTKCETCKRFYSTTEYENISRSEDRKINEEEPKAEKGACVMWSNSSRKILVKNI